ncbi:MAG: hypothetical protein JRH09_13550 [Deltaproteobacteria bacterium]|nr:hypothetical protein [Deltaproteobacteria bacterium]
MKEEIHRELLTERERTMAFNTGLQCAIYVLERAEAFSQEGRRYMIEALQKQIAESEAAYTLYLLGCLSEDFSY